MSTTSAMNRAAISGPTPYRSVNVVSGGRDQPGDLPLQFCCLSVDGDDAFEAPSAQCGADAGVVADQLERGSDPGAGGQDRDLLLVAGSQTAQLGVGPVDQAAAFTNQVLAVVEQGAQIRSRADGQPDRW